MWRTRRRIEEDVLTDAVREDDYTAFIAEFRERDLPEPAHDDTELA